jgi:hypothetical protein
MQIETKVVEGVTITFRPDDEKMKISRDFCEAFAKQLSKNQAINNTTFIFANRMGE